MLMILIGNPLNFPVIVRKPLSEWSLKRMVSSWVAMASARDGDPTVNWRLLVYYDVHTTDGNLSVLFYLTLLRYGYRGDRPYLERSSESLLVFLAKWLKNMG